MSKVAAFLPMLAGGTGMAIGAGLLGGSALLNSYGQKKHADRQEAANRQWLDYQNSKTQQFDQQEEANRELAQIALNENLAGSTQDARENVINTETDRLTGEFTAGLGDLGGQLTAGAQAPGTSQVFDDAFASSLSDATGRARERLKNLAKATAYGSGSMGGMGQYDMLRGQDAANTIGGVNDARRGDTRTLQRYQTVSPELLEYEQSPMVPLMELGGSFLLGGGGEGLQGLFGPGSTTGTGLTLADGGLTGAGFLPPQSPGTFSFMNPGTIRPKMRPEQFPFRQGPGAPF